MGSRPINSCPITPTYDRSIFEQQPADAAQVGPSCPVGESEPETGATASSGPAVAQSSALAPMQPFPMSDPLIKSALGPMLDFSDPKMLAYAREAMAQEA